MDRNAEYEWIIRVPPARSPRSIWHSQKDAMKWASPALYQKIQHTLCSLHLITRGTAVVPDGTPAEHR